MGEITIHEKLQKLFTIRLNSAQWCFVGCVLFVKSLLKIIAITRVLRQQRSERKLWM